MINPRQNSAQAAWRPFWFAVGLLIVLAAWFGARVFMFFNYSPMHHAMTPIYQDMAASISDGRTPGEINVSRVMRNKDAARDAPFGAATQEGDVHCQFKTLDPGYGMVFAAAREVFFFIPDTVMRVMMLQVFLDAMLIILLFATFYRWGFVPAVFGGLLYAAHSVFALSAATAWYHFWDGLVCTLSVVLILWIYRFSKDSGHLRARLIALALLLGCILGAGVWLRSSWFIFAPIIFVAAALSRHLRPWLGYAVLVYALFAGGMVLRATELNGALSYSTRTSWHTAFQALGRHPNPYGFEDNDLYLFERTHVGHGVNYNLCDYAAQDRAMAQDFQSLWAQDPGYIVQSIAQRTFSSLFSNFSDENLSFWNHGVLFLAWLGLIFALFAGGELRLFAVMAALLYGLLNTTYSLVYYIHREYSYPTQMLLLFGAVVAVAAVQKFLLQCWRRDWPSVDWHRPHPAVIVMLISATVMMVLFLPPVQKYLTPPNVVSDYWDSDKEIQAPAYLALLTQIHAMPKEKQNQFMQYARRHTHGKALGVDGPVFQYAAQNLRHARFINLDGEKGEFWFDKRADNDTYEALSRASKSIAGVGYEWIIGFDPADPKSWGGKQLRFKVLPNPLLPPERVTELLVAKFANWNWQLKSSGTREYIAVHLSEGCSETRMQLAQYFSHQCGDISHDSPKP